MEEKDESPKVQVKANRYEEKREGKTIRWKVDDCVIVEGNEEEVIRILSIEKTSVTGNCYMLKFDADGLPYFILSEFSTLVSVDISLLSTPLIRATDESEPGKWYILDLIYHTH